MAREKTTAIGRIVTAVARIYLIVAGLMFAAGMVGGAVTAYSSLSP